MTSAETRDALESIDREYAPIGCIGIGGFGSVFLAKKKSGRRVALKFMLMNTNDEDEFDTFTREIGAVVKLNNDSDKESNKTGNRDLSIVFFEDWKIGHHFVCIVMNYADGGTLLQEIERKASRSLIEPYSERRIASYALQICEALAYAHERGVAHHDVKSANILIDASAGGRLLLADFGTSVAPGEESVGFTKSYAAPELLASHEVGDYSNLQADKIDSFGVGCILYELVTCVNLEKLSSDLTLAQFIARGPGMEKAMTIGCMKLPWLPPTGPCDYVGYTHALKSLITNLLNPNIAERWLPSQLSGPLRDDLQSPLLLPNVLASQRANPGAPVTMDNIQLGMFVQRGPDWDDGDADGGIGSIGIVVKLDPDALYAEAAFVARWGTQPVEQLCCRIGAGKKFELQVGPTQLPDYCTGSNAWRFNGIVPISENDHPGLSIGKIMNENCMVVGMDTRRGMVFAAPVKKQSTLISSMPRPNIWHTNSSSFVTFREHSKPPSSWQPQLGLYCNVSDEEERSNVVQRFYDGAGGMKQDDFAVESIQRIQDTRLWESYAQSKERVALEYWGMSNEAVVFLGCVGTSSHNLQNFQSNGVLFSTKASVIHNSCNAAAARAKLQMVLGRVAVGRVHEKTGNTKAENTMMKYHSELTEADMFACRGSDLAYPQYIITYTHRKSSPVQRRIIRAVRPTDNQMAVNATAAPLGMTHQLAREAARQKVFGGSNMNVSSSNSKEERSPTKQCVICMENPVRYVLVPCGHPCICDKCIAPSVLRKLKGKCPECRASFRDTIIIFGRVVNDEA